MTYRKLIDLKFKKGLTTHDLVRRFPANLRQINEVALLDVPETVLREVVKEDGALDRLMRLKKRFSKLLPGEDLTE